MPDTRATKAKKASPAQSVKDADARQQERAEAAIDEGIVKPLTPEEKKELSETDFSSLIEQVQSEYTLSKRFIKPKWDEWALRIKLYNNQKRDKEAVGDNTLFATFQTVLAALYADQLSATWRPREQGDEEVAENLNITAEYDHDEMEKDVIDYEWDWEAMFFVRGLCALMEFDRDRMVPVPEIWNVLTLLRDPYASSVNGDQKGRGRARFLGREMRMTKHEMKELGTYFNFGRLKPDGITTESLVDENMRVFAEAAGLSDISKFAELKGDNATHRLLEWFTIWNGKRVFVTLAEDRKKVVRYHELETLDIPIIDRTIFPMPNSWDGVSLPDLVEDKQRARAVATNLALKSVKSSIHPMYLFDETKVKNEADLNFEFNKFIPVKGNPQGAVAPMQKDQVKQDVEYILDTLSHGAEQATATPDIQQGVRPQESGTATRDALINQKVDTRYSLAAKIFGWSEKRFWKQWYTLYKKHFEDDIDEKTVRIVGALGAQWRPFTRENLIGNTDPDVKIESRTLSEAKRFNELQQFRGYVQMLAADQNANLRFALRHMGKLTGLKTDVVDRLLPPTIEEMRAEEENDILRDGQKVQVLPTDDHQTHIEIHNKMEDTPEKFAHMNAHKRAMMLMRVRPELFPQQPQQGGTVEREEVPESNLPQPTGETAGNGRVLPINR